MTVRSRAVQQLVALLEEINQTRPEAQRVAPAEDTVLFGQGGCFDSLGLVNFVITAEARLEEEFGQRVVLADERAVSQKNSPFRTVGALADYVTGLLGESSNE